MNKFIKQIKKLFKKKQYNLTDPTEIDLWYSIKVKAANGYKEYIEKYPSWEDNIMPPWINDMTNDESKLLDKIHAYFYGDDWYTADAISCAQVNYVMYDDVKNKVIIKQTL